MSENDPYGGLAEHVVQHLGPARRRWTPPGDDPAFGATLHYPQRQTLPVVSAVTNGLRYQPIAASMPVELVCTLQTHQEPAALHLLHGAAQYLLQTEPQPQAAPDHMVGSDGPLVPDTHIRGLLFGTHPVFPDVSLFRGTGGEPVLQYLTLLPLTGADLRFLTEGDEGPGRQQRLWRRWRADRVEFWDVHRPE